MRIGLINELHGRPGDYPPSWQSIRDRALAAEGAGFDLFVFEDALLYRGQEATDGVWESMTVAGALAAATSTIEFGQSVINAPYRSPGLVASMATSLDEISAGRYVLGVGAGNTADSDYQAFGFPTDHRYSRFEEWIEIVYSLLREGHIDFEGRFHRSVAGELILRGPQPEGPRINIAAGGEKMLGLVARYADEWNWWGWDETFDQIETRLRPLLVQLESACFDAGRDAASLGRTFDLYSVALPGAEHKLENPVTGSPPQIADRILRLGELGFEEVRVDVYPKSVEAVAAMESVVELVHAG